MAIEEFEGQLPNPTEQDYMEDQQGREAEDLFNRTDITTLIKLYIEDKYPEHLEGNVIIKEFWATLSKNLKITFIQDKDDLELFDAEFDNAKFLFLMSRPSYEFTFEDMQTIQQIKLLFMASIRRSLGTPTHRINERVLGASSIQQRIRSNTEQMGGQKKGILGRLF